jgi:hypothetical protein
VTDPDTGALISDAEVAETPYTVRLGRGRTLTIRLVVRRVKDARYPDALFPVWRYHPFVTNSELPTAEADITHRRHAIIETTFADLIDGPLAHIPSGLFAANCAWLGCAVIAHNLLRAAGTLVGGNHAVARGATLRRDLVNACSLRRPGPQTDAAPASALALANRMENPVEQRHRLLLPDRPTPRRLTPPASPCPLRHPRPDPRNLATRKSWYRPADHAGTTAPHPAADQVNRVDGHTKSPIHGFRLRRHHSARTRRDYGAHHDPAGHRDRDVFDKFRDAFEHAAPIFDAAAVPRDRGARRLLG